MASNNQQPSFKTNVNRMKTKRWVEAKSYTYDGDDWGDADEYDEYDGYDEPAPGPAPHGPSGAVHQNPAYAQQPSAFPGAPQPAYMQQQQQQQPMTESPGRPPYAQDPRDRSGSFDRGDERRQFSGPQAPGPPNVAPLRTAYGSAPPNQSPRGASQQKSPPMSSTQAQPTFPGGRSSMEGHSQGPSGQLPPPVAPFAGSDPTARSWSMGSQGSQGSGSAVRSGVVQGVPGLSSRKPEAMIPGPGHESGLRKDWSSQPEADADADRIESPVPKIIRPADIYKRLAEEKERERLSQESGRPSISEITRSQDSDAIQSGPDDIFAGSRPRKQTLDTVAERKSEYALDGTLGAAHMASGSAPSEGMTEQQRKKLSTSPQLPDFTSGFGDDWISGFGSNPGQRQDVVAQSATTQDVGLAGGADVAQAPAGLGLSHKPSDGFTSAVHTAFDQPVEAPTPAGSEVIRSDTTSTSAISPIVSRNSSKDQDSSRPGELRAVNMGSIAEEGNIGAPHKDGVPSPIQQIDGKAQPSDELPPPGFVHGHRRNTSIPSPGNSPARQPKLEVRNIPQSEEGADFGAVTPNEERETRHRAASVAKAAQIQGVVESLSQQSREAPISISPTRSESPTKGRVKDLVEQAESAGSSRRGSDASLSGAQRPSAERAESFRPNLPGGWNSYTTNPMEPSSEQGAGETSPPADLSPKAVHPSESHPSSLPGSAVNPNLLNKSASPQMQHSTSEHTGDQDIDLEPTTRKRSLVHGEIPAESNRTAHDPYDSTKVAGAALAAGAVTAATSLGLSSGKSNPGVLDETRGQQSEFERGGTSLYPDSTRPLMPPSMDSTTTSSSSALGAHTPTLTSDHHTEQDVPAVAPLRQRGSWAPEAPVVASGTTLPPVVPGLQSPGSIGRPSEDSPMEDNDRLREDIVRQLTPNQPIQTHAEAPAIVDKSLLATGTPTSQQLPQSSVTTVQPSTQIPPKTLKHKFSWEADDSEGEDPMPAVRHAPSQPGSMAPMSPDPIIAPTQTITTVQSEPISEPVLATQTIRSDLMSPATLALREEPTVVEDSPARRLSSEFAEPTQLRNLSMDHTNAGKAEDVDGELTSPAPPTPPEKSDAFSNLAGDGSPNVAQQQFQPPSQGARQRGQTLSNSQVQVPAFREILAIKSPEDRLRVYRSTQDSFYNMNTGLSNWIQMMGDRHPEHKPLLQTTGNFSAPTPGLPALARTQTTGASQSASSGSGLSGLRKAGAAAGPSMNEAGAALKSAGRDTKKLAKGLFAKGRSKFGRDKGSSKFATVSSPPQKQKPHHPGQSPPQPQTQYTPYRPANMHSMPAASANVTTAPPAAPPAAPVYTHTHAPVAVAPSTATLANAETKNHTANQKSLPALPPDAPASDVASRPSDVSDLTSGSYDDERTGLITIAFPQETVFPPYKPKLQQRLTIHQHEIKPFEATFPSELLNSSAYKEQPVNAHSEVSTLPETEQPNSKEEEGEEDLPTQSTPKLSKFPTRSQSLSAARTLDPGVETFNTTPSWLNFDPQNSPADSDLFGSPSNKSLPDDARRDKRASLQIPIQTPVTKTSREVDDHNAEVVKKERSKAEDDRPFSFINFASAQDTDFSLNELAYRAPSRHSSVFTASTEDYAPSRPSTHDESLQREPLQDEDDESHGTKPLPQVPNFASQNSRANVEAQQSATLPARQAQKVSLFPQSTSRPVTRDSETGVESLHHDFAPRLHDRQQVQAASMPVAGAKAPRHRRGFSGSNLLQRALTAGMNTLEKVEAPLREKRNVIKAEKTDKRRRRFSGLNLLGKPKQPRRVPIEDSTPPGTPHGPRNDGIAALASTTQIVEQAGRPGMRRENVPEAIDVPVHNNRLAQSQAATALPLQQSSIEDGPTKTSPPPPHSQYSPRFQQGGSPQPQHQGLPARADSAYNESNGLMRHALPQGPQQPLQNLNSFQHSPPPSSPPTAQLPQLPQMAATLQREATLRNPNASPDRTVDFSQLTAADAEERPDVPLPRRSIDAFPRPPSKSSQGSKSPGGLSASPHSPSASVSTTRRSRGPSLSVDTNLANTGVSSRRASKQSRLSGASGTQASAKANSNENSKANSRAGSSGPVAPPAAEKVAPKAAEDSEDEIPSGLSAIERAEQQPIQAPKNEAGLFHPGTAEEITDRILTNSAVTGSATPGDEGAARKTTIAPATLRRMRQREIELGGETRLNSPMGPDSADIEPMPTLYVSGSPAKPEELKKEPEPEPEERVAAEDDPKEVVVPDPDDKLLHAEPADEDKIVMSATSFPGQEWNPYEMGF